MKLSILFLKTIFYIHRNKLKNKTSIFNLIKRTSKKIQDLVTRFVRNQDFYTAWKITSKLDFVENLLIYF